MLGARQPSAKRSAPLVGDFFASVPEAGLYLLEHILHDWDDAQAVRISYKLPTRDATRRPGYRCRATPRRDWRIRARSIHRSEHDGDANGPRAHAVRISLTAEGGGSPARQEQPDSLIDGGD